MKKLMIAAAIVCAAAFAQAATVTWSATGITQSTTGGSDLTKYMAYLIDDADFSIADVSAATYKNAVAAAIDSIAPMATGAATGVNRTIAGWDSGESYDCYVLVVDNTDGSFALTGKKTVAITDGGRGTAAAGAVGGWTAAAPEPTSGLLLLLGVAGLALKRGRRS